MIGLRVRLLAGAAALLLQGCEPPAPPGPPEAVLNQGMLQSLMDTGFYSEAALTQTIGRHYDPSTRRWKVLACFQFTVPEGEQGLSCVDSFEAFELDNGTWVVTVTIDGVYRWRAIGATGDAKAAGSPR